MRLETSQRFLRDMRRIRDADMQARVERAVAALGAADSVTEIAGMRRLTSPRGHHYRMRIGDYRLCISIEGYTAILARFLHRSDNYRSFPPR